MSFSLTYEKTPFTLYKRHDHVIRASWTSSTAYGADLEPPPPPRKLVAAAAWIEECIELLRALFDYILQSVRLHPGTVHLSQDHSCPCLAVLCLLAAHIHGAHV